MAHNNRALTELGRQWNIEMLNTGSNIETGTHSYSNSGYVIAGRILGPVSNMSWEALISEYLFEPLQMNNISFGDPDSDDTRGQPQGHAFQNNIWAHSLSSQGLSTHQQ